MLLDRFKEIKKREVNRLRQLENVFLSPVPFMGRRPSFAAALTGAGTGPLRIIAEYKRASPSLGAIALQLTPEEVAVEYAANGASCLSVLTEEIFFKGNIHYLKRMVFAGLPLLRKDFIFHSLQIAATAATPASALLLIVRFTPDVTTLRALREQAEAYGIEAVVEVFDETDLCLARESGARIIQVNARDLDTLKVDRLACLRLAEKYRACGKGEIWIAASGMERPEHLRQAADCGYQAALVGTALMRDGNPGKSLAALLGNHPLPSFAMTESKSVILSRVTCRTYSLGQMA